MNEKERDNYFIFGVFEVIAVVVASFATYDISLHFSPADVVIFGYHVTREVIAFLSVFMVDGLYVLIDRNLHVLRTRQSRTAAGYFLVFLWCVMMALNLASAVINNTNSISALGKFGFVIYAVKVMAMIYLAWYTYIRYDDPLTKRVLIEMEANETRSAGVNNYVQKYSQAFAISGAKIIAMDQSAEYILKETGKHPEDIFGESWREQIAKMAGISWTPTHVAADDEKPADEAATGTTGKGKRAAVPAPTAAPEPVQPLATGNAVIDFLAEKAGRVQAALLATGNPKVEEKRPDFP